MPVKSTLRLLPAILALLALRTPAPAQQLECTVKVNYESVGASHKDLLVNFQEDIRSYLNNYQWGPEQLDENIAAVNGPAFTTEELARIDELAGAIDVNLWAKSSEL